MGEREAMKYSYCGKKKFHKWTDRVQVSLESEEMDAYIELVIKEKKKMLSKDNRK